MNGTLIISIVFTLGITLLVIVMQYFPFGISSFNQSSRMYFRLNLTERKIIAITFRALKEDMDRLFDADYELIRSATLKAIINQKTPLPQRAFFVAANESCLHTLIKALPVLKKEKLSIIIFIPTFLVESNNTSREMDLRLQQLISP